MALNKSNRFDQRKIENILKTENQFITNLFSILGLPEHTEHDDESDVEKVLQRPPVVTNKTSRAGSLVELQNRIDKLKNKTTTYKEKVQKKKLKDKLKKKIKKEKRNATQNRIKKTSTVGNSSNKTENEVNATESKPTFNKDGKIVFSKIDFAGLGTDKAKKAETNPKKILEQVKQVKDKIQMLKEKGETEKAIQIKEKSVWKNALAKTQGIKVKDDPTLLKKSIQKIEQKKRSSKKKWENRIEGVKKAKDEKQKKRTENIEKRKKTKNLHKLKKAAKKGRIIPGL